ncbi:MAG: phage GP46 family protein [Halopseudomonas aestusnigri]
MTDIYLNWNSESFTADMSMQLGDIITGREIETAVIMSIFTWRRANADDELPEGETSRQGWWADTYTDVPNDKIGSRIWLARRRKMNQTTRVFIYDCIKECLQWLIEDQIAVKIDIETERQGLSTLATKIIIHETSGAVTALQYSLIWEAMNDGK